MAVAYSTHRLPTPHSVTVRPTLTSQRRRHARVPALNFSPSLPKPMPGRNLTLFASGQELKPETKETTAILDPPSEVLIDRDGPRTAVLSATKTESMTVEESGRPVSEYMALPASQYSVLDAELVERIDDDTFRCFISGINLLGFKVNPVITVSVTVQERGCVVRLLSCELRGNRLVEAANSRFNASMVNRLSWRVGSEESENKELVSDLTLEVVLDVPNWFRLVSPAAVSATGSKVMQQVVNQMVPRFLEQLKQDYALWASGDESRKPLGGGTIGLDQS